MAVQPRVEVIGIDRTLRQFAAIQAKYPAALRAVVTHFGLLLETEVKRNASGRPGPRAITGDYRRSITTEHTATGRQWVSTVGTNRPQGRRLEFGFHGVDSLGRSYNQRPYPHFGPAFDKVQPQFVAGINAAVRELLS